MGSDFYVYMCYKSSVGKARVCRFIELLVATNCETGPQLSRTQPF